MTEEKENDNFLLDILDDPIDRLIIQLLNLEENDESILDKILASGESKHD